VSCPGNVRPVSGTDWDARYAAEPSLWGAEPNKFVRARLAELDPGVALDLACGNGRNALWLARRGWQVTAVDISAVAVEQAASRGAALGVDVHWQHADLLEWTPPAAVDLALICYLHLPMPALIKVLRMAGAALRPGGRLLYVGHARTNLELGYGGPSDPAVLSEIADLATAAEGLRVRELAHLLRPTQAGDAIDILLDATPWEAAPLPEDGDADHGHTRGGDR
jgi:SAM-dependent methyltransferase